MLSGLCKLFAESMCLCVHHRCGRFWPADGAGVDATDALRMSAAARRTLEVVANPMASAPRSGLCI